MSSMVTCLKQKGKCDEEVQGCETPAFIATDVAASGLDVEGVTHVFNYDIPQDVESYIHRIGRTGRAGKDGLAITFVALKDKQDLEIIEKGIDRKLPRREVEAAQSNEASPSSKTHNESAKDRRDKKIQANKDRKSKSPRGDRSHKGESKGGRSRNSDSNTQARGRRTGRDDSKPRSRSGESNPSSRGRQGDNNHQSRRGGPSPRKNSQSRQSPSNRRGRS